MAGWALLKKSISLIYYNLAAALRISGMLWLVTTLLGALAMFAATGSLNPAPAKDFQSLDFGPILVAIVLRIIAFTWIAVAWHRYLLAGEESIGIIPAWPKGKVWPYIANSLLLGVIIVGVFLIIGLPGVALAAVTGLPTALLLIWLAICAIIANFVFLRFAVILPAIAMDKKMIFKQAWSATDAGKDQVIGLSVLVIILMVGLQLVTALGLLHPLLMVVISLIVSWFLMMVSVTLLSTLYGVYIEQRPLD